jgi:hypothetical protein
MRTLADLSSAGRLLEALTRVGGWNLVMIAAQTPAPVATLPQSPPTGLTRSID